MRSRTSREAARIDLQFLDIPPGLIMNHLIALSTVVSSFRINIRLLNAFLSIERRFGEVRDFLCAELGVERVDADANWANRATCLGLEFQPGRYRRVVYRHSEVLVREEES